VTAMTARLAENTENTEETENEDAYYVVIPDDVWQHEPEEPEVTEEEDLEVYDEDLYYLDREPKPLSFGAVTGVGGVSGSLAFGLLTGAVVGSPAGLAAGLAAGIFGGLMGRSVAEEFYDRRHN
jgi:hypothetical protein